MFLPDVDCDTLEQRGATFVRTHIVPDVSRMVLCTCVAGNPQYSSVCSVDLSLLTPESIPFWRYLYLCRTIYLYERSIIRACVCGSGNARFVKRWNTHTATRSVCWYGTCRLLLAAQFFRFPAPCGCRCTLACTFACLSLNEYHFAVTVR